jgi:hypothetical protein
MAPFVGSSTVASAPELFHFIFARTQESGPGLDHTRPRPHPPLRTSDRGRRWHLRPALRLAHRLPVPDLFYFIIYFNSAILLQLLLSFCEPFVYYVLIYFCCQRDFGGVLFLVVKDHTGPVQVLVDEKRLTPGLREQVASWRVESVV